MAGRLIKSDTTIRAIKHHSIPTSSYQIRRHTQGRTVKYCLTVPDGSQAAPPDASRARRSDSARASVSNCPQSDGGRPLSSILRNTR